MADRAREIVRLELMLEDASIEVVVGRVESEDSVGEGDTHRDDQRRIGPVAVGRYGEGSDAAKIPDLAQALTGHFDAHHARLARSMLRRLDLVEQALAELDGVIAEAAGRGSIRSSCWRPFPGSVRKSRR